MMQKGPICERSFLEEVKERMQTEGYDPHRVINIDQLGFGKEIYGHRTLNIRDIFPYRIKKRNHTRITPCQ